MVRLTLSHISIGKAKMLLPFLMDKREVKKILLISVDVMSRYRGSELQVRENYSYLRDQTFTINDL